MDVTITMVDAASGGAADVALTAAADVPASKLLAALRRAVGLDRDVALSIDGVPVIADGTAADCGLASGVVVSAGPPTTPQQSPLVELVVSCGPDSGRRLAMVPGEYVVGRDPQCDLAIADAAISRRHLRVTVAAEQSTVSDLDSANGTFVAGKPLPAGAALESAIGERIRLGDSELVLMLEGGAISGRRTSDEMVHRAPRLLAPAAAVEVSFPARPAPSPPTRIPLLAATAPLVAGVALALVLHQWQFLAFTALSPIMILGQAGSDRWSARRTSRAALADYEQATANAGQRLDTALAAERLSRHASAPDLAQLCTAASRRTSILWHRGAADPDALSLRLGRGALPSAIQIVGHRAVTVPDVPVCITLPSVGVLGICGRHDLATGLARSLVIQAATLHSPGALEIVVIAPGRSSQWAWARWLPQVVPRRGEACTRLVGFDDEQALRRINEILGDQARERDRSSRTLIIVDATPALRSSPAAGLLLDHADASHCVIWCAGDAVGPPAQCRAVVELTAQPRLALRLTQADTAGSVTATPDLLSAETADATARALAPLRAGDEPDSSRLPPSVRWSEVSEINLDGRDQGARALAHQWSLAASTDIAIGRDADCAVRIDLCRDGPHALIAGTTGSGKSELLLTLVAGLAARNRPDELSLLLIDHKGGAAFGRCNRLPHVVGVVTDLDASSTQRALLSLTAELRRREALFAAVGAADLDGYLATAAERLARLVIVVDEFAVLADEQPEFVGGLVGIAQRGRSLGVHLVLATQRPDGVVCADIRANTRLRICLGVARENESRDVIDSPAAASISRTTPGRAFLRVGPGELHEFQSARVRSSRLARCDASATLSPAAALGDPPESGDDDADTLGDTELAALVDAAVDLTATLRCVLPPPPWLPPLPDLLPCATLPAVSGPEAAPWGLVDLPATGQQKPLVVDLPRAGNTLIAGAPRSGRTGAALTLAVALAGRRSPDQLQIWAIDAAAGLAALADLPHCGAVVPAADTDRVERLLGYLSGLVARRREALGRQTGSLLLVLDSWERLSAAVDDRDGGRLLDSVLRLATDGPSAGLHLVITSDRGGLVGRLGAVMSEKIVLRLADPSDLALIGLAGRDLPSHLPPGRGIRAADLSLVQVAQLDEAAISAARAWPTATLALPSFAPLPQRVSFDDLLGVGRSADQIGLGIAAADLSQVHVRRPDVGRSLVIAGPAGSGRSSAMLLVAQQLTGRPLAISCSRRSPLAGFDGAIALPRQDQEHAVAILESLSGAAASRPDIMIDDLDLLTEGPLWLRLEQLLRGEDDDEDDSTDGGPMIVVCGRTEAIASAFRGPMAAARRSRVAVLLCPAGRHEGELFGITLPRRTRGGDPPGRGWLTSAGTAIQLQLAEPAARSPASAGIRDGQILGPQLLG
ncbi:MAG TPA: FtsK/SpoIIIE domain-containing protein [Mycobacteriales bacterium]|jgi:S-DNA-T family DNA segregation ATPase FtsK/SpoIIIE|nr:FtsK/SpoIIIE domain-containing protein [Mycobacteriales bacterium]